MTDRTIKLRGVRVHNLKSIDLDLPRQQLIVCCGVSGSGKSSLAFDTLYAEGQRRYIETFSAYTRQFLERLEKPAADRIEGIPPAIAVAAKNPSRSSRSTVGTATETNDYLRLLYARIGTIVCQSCGQEVRRETPESAADALLELSPGARYMIAFRPAVEALMTTDRLSAMLREEGFHRVIASGRIIHLSESDLPAATGESAPEILAVVDRLIAGNVAPERLSDSLETAFARGSGAAWIFIEAESLGENVDGRWPIVELDGHAWQQRTLSNRLRCDACGVEYPSPEPQLYSFNHPLGACPRCEGFGNVIDVDMDLVVPDPEKSIAEGAIAPWNTPAYAHEREELIALAPAYGIPVDVPYAALNAEQRTLIDEGVPEREFGGLRGFFAWLERRKYKMHIRVFLSRWRSYRTCPECGGARLKREALATRVGGIDIASLLGMKIVDAISFFDSLTLSDWQRRVGRMMLDQVRSRLNYLEQVGLGYLTLDRTLRTLSGGEAQRVALTGALGSSLVNMLYVLDEPSVGLHPQDTERLIDAITALRRRGNSVVVVEHEEAMIRAADHIVEIGPAAGERGGRVVFQGTPQEMIESAESLTGDYLAGRRGLPVPERRRTPDHGWIRLAGARGNNLQNITVEFPLGLLCVVSGVSGSGKSTLVQDTLYPALSRRLRKDAEKPAPFDDVFGDGQINDLVLVDQSPIGRSPRSNPVTYVKAFDEIRAVFADTLEAKSRGYTPSYFSFNVAGGRCETCEGDGFLAVDMQFLADVYMRCPTCNGRRYRREILDVTHRGRNIADVLDMTVREAFTFFRGATKVQARLRKLIEVGLDYVRLGQPANTLSGGEAQRLKLAAYLSSARRGRTLFLLDEPTTGLHFSDILQLLDCFDALLSVGHSLIVVEHNLHVIKAADYVIDLGPGAAEEGGQVVAQGTPERVSQEPRSVTGRFLAQAFAEQAAASDAP